jgi:hypothetical protein
MRRIKLATWAVVAALLLATVPMSTAQAAQPSRSTYTVFMTVCAGTVSPERDAGPTTHARGSWHTGNAFFLGQSGWVQSGTFSVDIDIANGGPSSYAASGTFAVRGSLLGDYDGTWAWNFGQGGDGHGVGQGIWSSKGNHIKVDFLMNPLPDLGSPDVWCDGNPAYGSRYLVMSTY